MLGGVDRLVMVVLCKRLSSLTLDSIPALNKKIIGIYIYKYISNFPLSDQVCRLDKQVFCLLSYMLSYGP